VLTRVSFSDDVASWRHLLQFHVVNHLANLARGKVLQKVVVHQGVTDQLTRSGIGMRINGAEGTLRVGGALGRCIFIEPGSLSPEVDALPLHHSSPILSVTSRTTQATRFRGLRYPMYSTLPPSLTWSSCPPLAGLPPFPGRCSFPRHPVSWQSEKSVPTLNSAPGSWSRGGRRRSGT
jgi:hypothetical protein